MKALLGSRSVEDQFGDQSCNPLVVGACRTGLLIIESDAAGAIGDLFEELCGASCDGLNLPPIPGPFGILIPAEAICLGSSLIFSCTCCPGGPVHRALVKGAYDPPDRERAALTVRKNRGRYEVTPDELFKAANSPPSARAISHASQQLGKFSSAFDAAIRCHERVLGAQLNEDGAAERDRRDQFLYFASEASSALGLVIEALAPLLAEGDEWQLSGTPRERRGDPWLNPELAGASISLIGASKLPLTPPDAIERPLAPDRARANPTEGLGQLRLLDEVFVNLQEAISAWRQDYMG